MQYFAPYKKCTVNGNRQKYGILEMAKKGTFVGRTCQNGENPRVHVWTEKGAYSALWSGTEMATLEIRLNTGLTPKHASRRFGTTACGRQIPIELTTSVNVNQHS